MFLCANTVGYQAKALNAQENSFITMTLLPIGVEKSEITLSSFVPTSGENGWMYNTDYLATIKPNGTFDKKYGYLSPYWAGPEGLDDDSAAGWHLYSNLQTDEFYGDRVDNEKIPWGTGVAVFTGMSDVTITFAGQVLADEYGIPLNAQANTFTGIICPSDLKLGDLSPTSGENGWMYNTDYLATIKPNGTFDKKYGYLSPYWAGPEGLDDDAAAGWHLYSNLQTDEFYGERADNINLSAGQAVAVFTSMVNIELVVPSALPDTE